MAYRARVLAAVACVDRHDDIAAAIDRGVRGAHDSGGYQHLSAAATVGDAAEALETAVEADNAVAPTTAGCIAVSPSVMTSWRPLAPGVCIQAPRVGVTGPQLCMMQNATCRPVGFQCEIRKQHRRPAAGAWSDSSACGRDRPPHRFRMVQREQLFGSYSRDRSRTTCVPAGVADT